MYTKNIVLQKQGDIYLISVLDFYEKDIYHISA